MGAETWEGLSRSSPRDSPDDEGCDILSKLSTSSLHQMMQIRWAGWRSLRPALKTEVLKEASEAFGKMEQNANGQSALFSLIGHKGDLMFVHFRESFEDLNQAELQLACSSFIPVSFR